MLKINSAPNDSAVVQRGQEQLTETRSKGQRYIFNQSTQDKTCFSGNKSEAKPKNNHAIVWILGAGATIAAVIIAVKKHNKIAVKTFEKSVIEQNSKTVRSSQSGKYEHSKEYKESIKVWNRDIEIAQKTIDRHANKMKLNEASMQKFEFEFENILENKSLGDLKRDIVAEIRNITNFDKPSEVCKEHLAGTTANYNEKFFINMYSYVKKQQPQIKDPIEMEKSKQCGVFILSKLRTFVLSSPEDAGLTLKKLAFVDSQISRESDDLLNHYFGKIGTKSKSSLRNSDFELPTEVRNKIKKECQYQRFRDPHQMFSDTINATATSYLEEILAKHVKNNIISEDGRNLTLIAELLNKKAIEINKTMKTTDTLIVLDLGSTAKTINNYKQGKFKSGCDEFWEEYFNNKYKNAQSKASNAEIEDESFKIFKKYGEDLGDLNDLKEESLKKAYRKLAMQHHPDTNSGNSMAHENFTEILNAYQALSKKVTKK